MPSLRHDNLYKMQVEKRGIKNLNTKKQGWGGWDDLTLAIPRKRMGIVIKRHEKNMCEDACPVHQMAAVTSARPKMVAGNERNKFLFSFVLLHFTQPKRSETEC